MFGDMKSTVTPSSSAAFCAPSFIVIQCWSIESIVISAIFSPSAEAPIPNAAVTAIIDTVSAANILFFILKSSLN